MPDESPERSSGRRNKPPDPPEPATSPTGQQPPPAPDGAGDDRDDPRRVAHELVGQTHAVLFQATRDSRVLEIWCPEHLRQPFLDARPTWWEAVGDLQVAIASGDHDEQLRAAGIGGVVSRHKRAGLRHATQRLIAALRPGGNPERAQKWTRTAASLARTAVGSLARELPGGEIIAEALDGVIAAVDTPRELKSDVSAASHRPGAGRA